MKKAGYLLFYLFSSVHLFSQVKSKGNYTTNKYTEVSAAEISPQGWLLNQLRIMNAGTTGHLDEVYAKLKNDNGWLGGKGDGWEETPYWLDGAVPLAYLLKDDTLKQKVVKYINWVMEHQRPSGYFGPITKYERETHKPIDISTSNEGEDWWPKMIMLKVLQQYYMASKDLRVISFMNRYFQYQLKTLRMSPLVKWSEWAQYRGMDNTIVAEWLYNITKNKDLLSVIKLLQEQTNPWSAEFKGRNWVINAAAQQNDSDWMSRHGVNVAMGLKDPIAHYQYEGRKENLHTIKQVYKDLMLLHGLPNGMFTADEDLHGNLPTQGSELCALVETMFSLEQIIAATGDPFYMDALERIAFNALPAQTTDDYNNKQYFQIANQVQIKRGVFNFSLPFGREMNNVLGMRSGYTCCLANMHQGWTKFATHLWFKTNNNGIAGFAYAPNSIKTTAGINNVPVQIDELTSYPFDEKITFKMKLNKAEKFLFQLRIPSWCSSPSLLIDGKAYNITPSQKIISLNRIWNNNSVIELTLPMKITTTNWARNSRSIERGPVVYALKIKEKWERSTQEKEGAYYSVYPESDWNYGLIQADLKDPSDSFTIKKMHDVTNDFIWNLDHAPFEISVKGKRIPAWKIVDDVAPQPVTDRDGAYRGKVEKDVQPLTLVPYGCTKIRIVAFPVVE